MTTGEKVAVGFIAGFLIIIVVLLVYAIAGLLFATLWNWLMPALWASAPHLSWKAGVAAAWLIGVAQTIFSGGLKIDKKG